MQDCINLLFAKDFENWNRTEIDCLIEQKLIVLYSQWKKGYTWKCGLFDSSRKTENLGNGLSNVWESWKMSLKFSLGKTIKPQGAFAPVLSKQEQVMPSSSFCHKVLHFCGIYHANSIYSSLNWQCRQ